MARPLPLPAIPIDKCNARGYRMTRIKMAILASAVALSLVSAATAQDVAQRLQAITLTASIHKIRAEVAMTPEQRQKGLMYRRDLGSHEGMLFVFDEAAPQCFWMRNTPLPLSIAFLADDGIIVNLADMKPFSDDSHCSARPVRYALEMNQGWFAKRGLKAGARLGGPPFRP